MVSGTMQAGMQDGLDYDQPSRMDITALQGRDMLLGGGKRRKTKRRKTKGRKTKKRRHQTVRKTLSQLRKSLSLSM